MTTLAIRRARERDNRVEPRLAVDLNFDGGEGYDDGPLMRCAATVNIACGGHAGDGDSMRASVRLALRHSVAMNAHPSYPDREHFGRVSPGLPPAEVQRLVYGQVATLYEIARTEETLLVGVKPHGGLYHDAARNEAIAAAVARAVLDVSPELILVGPPRALLLQEGRKLGMKVAKEAIVDRSYAADGTLVPRGGRGAVIEDPAAAARQALSLARQGCLVTREGETIRTAVDTLCFHSDNPNAAAIGAAVRQALLEAKVIIRNLRGWLGGDVP